MRQLVSGAVLGACLVAVPQAVGPDVEHREVQLAAVVDTFGDMGSADDPLLDWVGSLGASAGPAEADPFIDLFQQISNYLQGALLLGALVFGGVVANVAQFLADVYDWFAGIFGFESYGVIDVAPALASDLSAVLGDFTVPLPALDCSGGADVTPTFDDAGISVALVSGLGS